VANFISEQMVWRLRLGLDPVPSFRSFWFQAFPLLSLSLSLSSLLSVRLSLVSFLDLPPKFEAVLIIIFLVMFKNLFPCFSDDAEECFTTAQLKAN
jgi:hypothetical protein